ncbi:hypothetical protein Are01nite_34400 [Actinoplanes regularis]|nr:hypothetical protein Are01nite_34400 [Actinoplanes regularis]
MPLMMIVFVALIGLVVALGLAFWPWPGRAPAVGRAAVPEQAGRPEPVVPEKMPDSLEGVLTVQLMGGEISRRQYVRALERIAARDERRHPMSVPPDYRP